MFDINKFTDDLVNYVTNGVLTQENAEAVYEAACIKYGFDPETGEAIEETYDDMSLESALAILEADEAKADDAEVTDEELAKYKAAAKTARKETAKKVAKALAITTVATAAVTAGTIGALAANDKARTNQLASCNSKVKALNNKFLTDEYQLLGNESNKEMKKKYNKILGLQKEIESVSDKIEKLSSPSLLKKLQNSTVGTKVYQSNFAKKIANNKTDKMIKKGLKDLENGKISNIELDDIYKQVSDISKKHGIKTANESSMDLINDFLFDRMMEAADSAPAEANPATHVEDEIDEKLPVENPNEPTPIGCTEDIEKTDKAIEDAKKYLDVAAKLAEMKSAHEAEKDTTQQHEVIKQALESTEDQIKLIKLNIYESADAGIITEEEKKELLDILNVIED